MDHGRNLLATAAVSIALLVAFAAPAWAPKYLGGIQVQADCTMSDGTAADFSGTYFTSAFSDGGDKGLLVEGNLSGECRLDDDTYELVNSTVTTSATIEESTCTNFAVRPGSVNAEGVVTDLSEILVGVNYNPASDPRSMRGELCSISRQLAHRDATDLVRQLNRLLG